MGDGFSEKERSEYNKRVHICLGYLWSVSPFRELKGKFNVHVVDNPSPRQPGWDSQGRRKSTGSSFRLKDSTDKATVISASQAQIKEVLEAAKSAPEADAVILLTTRFGRSRTHLGNAILLTDGQFDAVTHELGHLIGGLGDEYIDAALLVGRTYDSSNGDLAYPNLHRRGYLDTSSRQSLKETTKW